MIDADNDDRTSSPHLTHSNDLFSPIHFRRGGIRSLRDPLPGGRGDAAPLHNGVHHVQISADYQLDQVPDRAVRGLLRGVRGDRKVRRDREIPGIQSFTIHSHTHIQSIRRRRPTLRLSLVRLKRASMRESMTGGTSQISNKGPIGFKW